MYRPARFVKNVRVVTFKDVNVEELEKPDWALTRPAATAGPATVDIAILVAGVRRRGRAAAVGVRVPRLTSVGTPTA